MSNTDAEDLHSCSSVPMLNAKYLEEYGMYRMFKFRGVWQRRKL